MRSQALLDAGVPSDQVARLERMLSTFVLGYAVSEVGGSFSRGTLGTRERRGQLPGTELPPTTSWARGWTRRGPGRPS